MGNRFRYVQPLALKLRRIAKAKGQTVGEVAKQIGVHKATVSAIFRGAKFPDYEVANRLRGWALENRKYKRLAVSSMSYSPRYEPNPELWSHIFLKLPKRIHQRLRAVALDWGVSQAVVIHLVLENLLSNEGLIKGWEAACHRVAKTRLEQALAEAPALQDILVCEEAWAATIGRRAGSWDHEIAKVDPFPLEELDARTTLEGAAISPVYNEDTKDYWMEDCEPTDSVVDGSS